MKRALACLLALLLCAACPALAGEAVTLSRFELYRHGEIMFDSYDIATRRGRLTLSVNGGAFAPIDDSVGEALLAVIDRYGLVDWDGFDDYDPNVLDGEGFRIEFDLSDGTSVQATGDNAFPDHYFDAIGEITGILEDARPAPALSMAGIADFLAGLFSPNSRERIVGTDVANGDIHDFYYTYASSTFPPEYQRYRFYTEGGRYLFFHETREGEVFPLTEEYATVTGTVELTGDEWDRFLDSIAGGTVKAREESLDSGDAGPWMYLYYEGDQGIYQEYSFTGYGARLDFEALCEALRSDNRSKE